MCVSIERNDLFLYVVLHEGQMSSGSGVVYVNDLSFSVRRGKVVGNDIILYFLDMFACFLQSDFLTILSIIY